MANNRVLTIKMLATYDDKINELVEQGKAKSKTAVVHAALEEYFARRNMLDYQLREVVLA